MKVGQNVLPMCIWSFGGAREHEQHNPPDVLHSPFTSSAYTKAQQRHACPASERQVLHDFTSSACSVAACTERVHKLYLLACARTEGANARIRTLTCTNICMAVFGSKLYRFGMALAYPSHHCNSCLLWWHNQCADRHNWSGNTHIDGLSLACRQTLLSNSVAVLKAMHDYDIWLYCIVCIVNSGGITSY
jgi:hypothetical protein